MVGAQRATDAAPSAAAAPASALVPALAAALVTGGRADSIEARLALVSAAVSAAEDKADAGAAATAAATAAAAAAAEAAPSADGAGSAGAATSRLVASETSDGSPSGGSSGRGSSTAAASTRSSGGSLQSAATSTATAATTRAVEGAETRTLEGSERGASLGSLGGGVRRPAVGGEAAAAEAPAVAAAVALRERQAALSLREAVAPAPRHVAPGDAFDVAIEREGTSRIGVQFRGRRVTGITRGSPVSRTILRIGDEVLDVNNFGLSELDASTFAGMFADMIAQAGGRFTLQVRRGTEPSARAAAAAEVPSVGDDEPPDAAPVAAAELTELVPPLAPSHPLAYQPATASAPAAPRALLLFSSMRKGQRELLLQDRTDLLRLADSRQCSFASVRAPLARGH